MGEKSLSLEEIIVYGGDIFRYIIGKRLHEEGVETISDETAKLIAEAIEAYEDGDIDKAFRLLRKAFAMTDVKAPTELAQECIREMNKVFGKIAKIDKEKLIEKLLDVLGDILEE